MPDISEKLNDDDLQKIANQVLQGYTSGILDNEGMRVSWNINIEKFNNT